MAGSLFGSLIWADLEDGGPYRIVEPVTRLNEPVWRKVRLCDQKSGRVIREAWSDPATGNVTFELLAAQRDFILYALDHTLEFEAVIIADRWATADGTRP